VHAAEPPNDGDLPGDGAGRRTGADGSCIPAALDTALLAAPRPCATLIRDSDRVMLLSHTSALARRARLAKLVRGEREWRSDKDRY